MNKKIEKIQKSNKNIRKKFFKLLIKNVLKIMKSNKELNLFTISYIGAKFETKEGKQFYIQEDKFVLSSKTKLKNEIIFVLDSFEELYDLYKINLKINKKGLMNIDFTGFKKMSIKEAANLLSKLNYKV